jgi:type II secretory pathway pseudopilin PulG
MNQRANRKAAGTVLICVMVCLGIVTALIATSTQFALRSRRETRVQRQLLQVDFLCEAGYLRAKSQLSQSPEYRGETWRPQVPELGDVMIEIDIAIRPSDNGDAEVVEVSASLSETANPTQSVRKSHPFEINQLNSKKQEIP